MGWRNYFILFLMGFLSVLAVSFFQRSPGYMDADYYYAGGLRLVRGYGFSEPFLWNYLDDPLGLPHPSHAYWMPMASMLAALGMLIAPVKNFTAAKACFLILAGFIPVITGALSFSITSRKDQAWLAGLLSVIPGFYLSYLGTTDVFGIYMLLGGVWFLVIGNKRLAGTYFQAVLLGLICGFMHMTRADGLLWLFISLLGINFLPYAAPGDRLNGTKRWFVWWRHILSMIFCITGYLLVMGPWLVRDYSVYGTLLAPGGMRSLWLTNYDELYIYPVSILTPGRWLSSGIWQILSARAQAMGLNLQTAGVVQGEIFLVPLILLGLWQYKRELRIHLGVLAWLLTFGMMTVIFPFVGWRGGFFHSGTAVQPLFWAVAPAGLSVFIDWGSRVRNWNSTQANAIFGAGLVGLALMLSVLVVRNRVIGSNIASPSWGESQLIYNNLEKQIEQIGIKQDDVVMVNNPPGYYIASGGDAISIPMGGIRAILEVARKYGADYLLLEQNQGLTELYTLPMDHPGLDYLMTIDGVRVFRIER